MAYFDFTNLPYVKAQIGDDVELKLGNDSILARITGIHFYSNCIKYDLMLFVAGKKDDGSPNYPRIYNVGSEFVNLIPEPDPCIH